MVETWSAMFTVFKLLSHALRVVKGPIVRTSGRKYILFERNKVLHSNACKGTLASRLLFCITESIRCRYNRNFYGCTCIARFNKKVTLVVTLQWGMFCLRFLNVISVVFPYFPINVNGFCFDLIFTGCLAFRQINNCALVQLSKCFFCKYDYFHNIRFF